MLLAELLRVVCAGQQFIGCYNSRCLGGFGSGDFSDAGGAENDPIENTKPLY